MPIAGEFSGITALGNGMRIAVLPFARKSRVRIDLLIFTGSHEGFIPKKLVPGRKNTVVTGTWHGKEMEFQYVPGIDHAVEHMVFRGLKKNKFRTPIKVVRFFRPLDRDDENDISAETSEVGVAYFLEVAPEFFEQAVEFLAELTLRPLLAEKGAAVKKWLAREWTTKERRIVLHELGWSADDPWLVADEITRTSMFPGHPLGYTATGEEDDIHALTVRQMAVRHRMTYHPSNMLLTVIGGGLPMTRIKRTVTKHFRAPRCQLPNLHIPPPKIHSGKPIRERVRFITITPKKTYFAIGFPFRLPTTNENATATAWVLKRYSIWVLKKVFGGRWASAPSIELREKRGLGYRHYAMLDEFPGVGTLLYTTHLYPDEMQEALRVLLKIFGRLATKHIPKREFEDAKRSWSEELNSDAESPQKLAEFIFKDLRFRGKVSMLSEVKKAIMAVSAEDVLRVAREILVPERLFATFTGNLPDKPTQRKIIQMLDDWKL